MNNKETSCGSHKSFPPMCTECNIAVSIKDESEWDLFEEVFNTGLSYDKHVEFYNRQTVVQEFGKAYMVDHTEHTGGAAVCRITESRLHVVPASCFNTITVTEAIEIFNDMKQEKEQLDV